MPQPNATRTGFTARWLRNGGAHHGLLSTNGSVTLLTMCGSMAMLQPAMLWRRWIAYYGASFSSKPAHDGYSRAEPFFLTKLSVPGVQIRWKREFMHTPVFRQTIKSSSEDINGGFFR